MSYRKSLEQLGSNPKKIKSGVRKRIKKGRNKFLRSLVKELLRKEEYEKIGGEPKYWGYYW